MNCFTKIKDKVIKGGGIFTFLRSIVSSQVASWIDLGVFTLLCAMGVGNLAATPIGNVCGGVVNCAINYKFTFRAEGVSVPAVVVKYAMVWLGSMLLNTFGTYGLAILLGKWDILHEIGFTSLGNDVAARLIVSLLVSWFWNFVLQKNFVYRPRKFDSYVDRLLKVKS